MKSIDIKSLIIGALLTSTIFLGVAATSPTDKWDDKQEWDYMFKKWSSGKAPVGYQPFAVTAIVKGKTNSFGIASASTNHSASGSLARSASSSTPF